MGYTANLHLYLPALGEMGYGEHLNENFEILDETISQITAAVDPTSYLVTGCQIIGPTANPPEGFLLCDGREVSRSTYAKLFAAIGTTYGIPSDATKFKLPNKVGRVVVGADPTSANPDYTLGKTGGAEKVTLTTAQMPAHDHGGETGDDGSHNHTASTANAGKHNHTASSDSTGNHNHSNYDVLVDYNNTMGNSGGAYRYNRDDSTTGYAGTHSHTITVNENGEHTHPVTVNENGEHAHSIGSVGSGQAHENRMPYIAEYWWIKT